MTIIPLLQAPAAASAGAFHFTTLDWAIIGASIAVSFLPALFFWRRASSNTSEFFTSGRAAPWWLVGISMVATTFSTDTPNLVTNMVRERGVAENWLWWSFLLTGMMTVFFYARLWRRSGVLTDLEFYEIRYSGDAAKLLRGFRAVYLGFFFNLVIMATVNLAAAKIGNIVLGWPTGRTLLVCAVMTIFFASVSGLWGVLVTDSIQFGITMTGTFAVAYYAVQQPAVGGLSGLFAKVPPHTIAMLPDFGDWSTALAVFILPLTIQWWSVWYPGAEPGGGSYIAQRMLASKTEKDAVVGTLLFNVMHYALRPWPWIIVALASTIIYPQLSDIATTFPNLDKSLLGNDIAYPAMMRFLPAGFLGLVVAGTLAAYRSTIETHLNWGTSYLVHDFYRRFLRPGLSERHYVFVGRLTTAGLMICAAFMTYALGTAREAFELILSIGAGTGLLYLLRWFWWRVSAWSEIAAMISSFLVALGFFIARKNGFEIAADVSLIITVAVTTVVWVTTTFLAPATDAATLDGFFMKVRPSGPGWRPVAERLGIAGVEDSLPQALLGWVLGCAFVYSGLFGTGSLLYGRMPQFAMWLVVFVVSGIGLSRVLRGFWTPESTAA
jgi:Na+/proline symporter